MRYICLMYQDETAVQNLPKEEMAKLNAEYREFGASLQKGGKLVTSQGLSPTHTATTVRVRGGKTMTTDGPYAETKEQLGGIYIIEAENLDEAVKFAASIPSARIGAIEVRPAWG